MEIRDVVRLITKHWLLIALLTVVCIVCALIISTYFLQNVYESSAVMIISSPRDRPDQGQLTLNDYNLNIKLVNSYRVLCKTDRILNQVIVETKLPLTTKSLSEKINVKSQDETEIISISVQDTNPETAALIANATAAVFVKDIPEIMRMDNVQIIDKAIVSRIPVKPDRRMILIVAVLLGLLVGVGLALLIDYFDVSVKNAEQLARLLEVPVLGTIPHMQEGTR